LAHETERGALDKGHQVEFISLKDKNIMEQAYLMGKNI